MVVAVTSSSVEVEPSYSAEISGLFGAEMVDDQNDETFSLHVIADGSNTCSICYVVCLLYHMHLI